MSRSDIICVIVIFSFCSLCFGGLGVWATWFVIMAPPGTLRSTQISNGFGALYGVWASALFLWLSHGLWMNPDHDAVLGRC